MAGSDWESLKSFLEGHPSIRHTLPSSPGYPSVSHVWSALHSEVPLAIVHPESASDVSRTIRKDTLTIDMRAISSIDIATDRQSATVGGGCLLNRVATRLWHQGLGTLVGTIPSVGYVGWAVYGGYGPFSPRWGLGVDQVIGATIVNADGEIIKADANVLKGIRGAGGIFGIIADLTIKVYPLKTLLAGVVLYDSQDIGATFTKFNVAYESLQAGGIPSELSVQQVAFNAPPGRLFGVIIAWISDDVEEGQRWVKKIAGLGSVVMNTAAATTIAGWMAGNEALVPATLYGTSCTHSFSRITDAAVTIVDHLEKLPSDPSTMLSIHQLRGHSASPKSDSVFASGEPHYMLEIEGCATTKELTQESQQWALGLWKDLQENHSESILPTAYISLSTDDGKSSTLRRHFGDYVEEILALKKRVGPENVFNLTVPQLSE